jgi:hypothetical protein
MCPYDEDGTHVFGLRVNQRFKKQGFLLYRVVSDLFFISCILFLVLLV